MSKSYDEFAHAMRVPMTYDGFTICWWHSFYCQTGHTARSLGGRRGNLKRTAQRRGMTFPVKGTPGHSMILDTERALKKIDPTEPDRATVVGMAWIDKVLANLGIRTVADYWTCSPSTCQLAVRALLAHSGMLRGCEHRKGLRVSDVVTIEPTHVVVHIAKRYSSKKKKLCEGRHVVLAVEDAIWSAGRALTIFLLRFHGNDAGDAALFFQVAKNKYTNEETPRFDKPASDAYFIKRLKAKLRAAGMSKADMQRVSNHSLRAGGATDFSVAGLSHEAIKAQGGWTSYCFLLYVRPAKEHRWRVAVDIMRAVSVARLRPPSAR